jgi:hypothetical protein
LSCLVLSFPVLACRVLSCLTLTPCTNAKTRVLLWHKRAEWCRMVRGRCIIISNGWDSIEGPTKRLQSIPAIHTHGAVIVTTPVRVRSTCIEIPNQVRGEVHDMLL